MKKNSSIFWAMFILVCFGFSISCMIMFLGGLPMLTVAVLLAIVVEVWAIERRFVGYPGVHRKTLSWLGWLWHAMCAVGFVFLSEPVYQEMVSPVYNETLSGLWWGILAALLIVRFAVVQPLYVRHCDKRRKLKG